VDAAFEMPVTLPRGNTKSLRNWIDNVGTKTAYIELDSPRENGHCESFNRRLRDGLLNWREFLSLREAEVLIEARRRHHRVIRPSPRPVLLRVNVKPRAGRGLKFSASRLI